MKHTTEPLEPAPDVPDRWALTKLTPICPQCGTPLAMVMPDGDSSWATDCQPHTVHCNACDLSVRAYFSVSWPRAVLDA